MSFVKTQKKQALRPADIVRYFIYEKRLDGPLLSKANSPLGTGKKPFRAIEAIISVHSPFS